MELFATYNYQSEADTFVRTFNSIQNMGGRVASSVRVGPGVYQVFIEEPKSLEEHFFHARKAA